jgi:alkyl hydroperoxide reductase subunit AhpC
MNRLSINNNNHLTPSQFFPFSIQNTTCSTAVCTTEIGRLAMKYDELKAMDCLVATLSVDPVKSHEEWLRDVVAHW